jgi:hypothetical protein
MLYRRLDKLQLLFSCTATLDKAKPEKKAAVSLWDVAWGDWCTTGYTGDLNSSG